MTVANDLGAYWREAWAGAGLSAPAAPLEDLLQRHAEPHRHYHTQQHLRECFAQFELLRADCCDVPAVLLALWFHDAIYDTHASDNEARSAALAEQVLSAGGGDAKLRQCVSAMIMATCHSAATHEGDTQLLLDIDLSILGANPERFAEYEQQIRREYAWVEPEAYRQGRAAILQQFLDRPRLFQSPLMQAREAQARLNLAESLRALGLCQL